MQIRKLDELGRIVLPKDYCDAMGLAAGAEMRVEAEGDTVVIRPYRESCTLCGSTEELVPVEKKKLCRSCITYIKEL